MINRILTFFALFWVLGLIFAAVFASYISPYDPTAIDIKSQLEGPSTAHLIGTDALGRDLLSRMLFGTRISLSVGFIAVGISTVIGVLWGAISGYFGGRLDRWMMGVVDIMLCFPTFFLILSVIAMIQKPGIFPIMVIIGLTSWMGTARLIRSEILSLKEREFIMSSKALGASHIHIIFRHLIPNALGPVWVTVTLGVGSAILVESGLSFLGIGVQPPTPSWGNILIDGKASLGVSWWLMFFPGMAILITVLSYNLLGEALRDRINQHRKT